MPIDIALVKHALAELETLSGQSLPEEVLAAAVEIRAGRPLTTNQVRDTLAICRDNGWASRRKDDFQRDVWWITDAGINKFRQM